MKIARIHQFELEEFLINLLKLDEESNISDIDETLQSRFNIDFDSFRDLMEQLMPLINVAESPLTGTIYKGFADLKQGLWLLKIEA